MLLTRSAMHAMRAIAENFCCTIPRKVTRLPLLIGGLDCKRGHLITSQRFHSKDLINCGYKASFSRMYSSVPNQHIEESGEEEKNPETVRITYIDRDGERQAIDGKVGDNVMYLAQRHDLEVEGACEASLACCTCHVYVKEKFYDMLGEPTEEEEDMLDLAPFLQENSRLSCQIILSKEIDGIEVQLPSATRNFYVDGHKPKPH